MRRQGQNVFFVINASNFLLQQQTGKQISASQL